MKKIDANQLHALNDRVHEKVFGQGNGYFIRECSSNLSEAFEALDQIDRDYQTSDFSLSRDYEGIWSVKLRLAGEPAVWLDGFPPAIAICLATLAVKGDKEWIDNWIKKGSNSEKV